MDRIFRYVPHRDVPAYEAAGWLRLACLIGTYHGQWAALMEWPGPDRPGPLSPLYDDQRESYRVDT